MVYVYRDLNALRRGGALQWRVATKPKSAKCNSACVSLVLADVTFKIARGNYDQIQRQPKQGRLVCAFACGTVVDSAPSGTRRRISFNPLKHIYHFYYCDNGQKIESARALEFTAQGECYAIE